jgi:hypothetical protein
MQTNKFDGRLLRLEKMAGAFTLWAGSTVKTLCEVMYGKESTPGTHRLETAIRLHSIPKLLDRPRHLREELAQFQHVNQGSPISLDRHKRIEEAQQEAEKSSGRHMASPKTRPRSSLACSQSPRTMVSPSAG